MEKLAEDYSFEELKQAYPQITVAERILVQLRVIRLSVYAMAEISPH
ncbi:MAG: hypothetical protein H0W62_07970 [Chitinophagales bacterium]|nr:hypothetical protein [Chitinophagales bacterium]